MTIINVPHTPTEFHTRLMIMVISPPDMPIGATDPIMSVIQRFGNAARAVSHPYA